MWKWIVGSFKSAHPLDRELATPRALRRFIDGLPVEGAESLRAVATVFDASASLGIAPAARLRALCALDEFARPSCRALSGRLLDNSPKQVLCEDTWKQLFDYYRALEGGYAVAIERFDTRGVDADLHAQFTAAACRAMHAMAKANMLLRMRYRESASGSWQRIEHMLELSRTRSAASALLALYPGEPGETSLQREYLIAAAFEMAPNANLLPAQIHGVDLLLRRHAAELRIGDRYDAALMPFAIDPTGDAPPKRWIEGAGPRPGSRFFGLGEAYAHIGAEGDRAARARSIPEWLAASQLSTGRYRELLDALVTHWAPKPPARQQRREVAAGELLVAHDFALIRRLVRFGELSRSGRSLEYDRFNAYGINDLVRGHNDVQLRAPTEAPVVSPEEALRNLESFERALEPGTIELWKLADVSVNGLGLEATGRAAWTKPGMLIAYRDPDNPQWALAIVRRLNAPAAGKLRVGLHKIAGPAIGARVAVNDARHAASRAPSTPTLHYDALAITGEQPSLLLPPGVFDTAWRYTLTVGHRWDFIRMQRCTECGLDFEQVAYTIVRAQQAA